MILHYEDATNILEIELRLPYQITNMHLLSLYNTKYDSFKLYCINMKSLIYWYYEQSLVFALNRKYIALNLYSGQIQLLSWYLNGVIKNIKSWQHIVIIYFFKKVYSLIVRTFCFVETDLKCNNEKDAYMHLCI